MKTYRSKYVAGNIAGISGSVHLIVRYKTHNIWERPVEGYSSAKTGINNSNYHKKKKHAIWNGFRVHLYNVGESSNTIMQDYKILREEKKYFTEKKLTIKRINVYSRAKRRIAKKNDIPLYVLKRYELLDRKDRQKLPQYVEVTYNNKKKLVKIKRDDSKVRFNGNAEDKTVTKKEYKKMFKK